MGYNVVQNSDGTTSFVSEDSNQYEAVKLHTDGSVEMKSPGTSPANKVVFTDDFLAGALDAKWSSTAGSGTANEVLTVVANSTNGEATMKSATDDGTHGANGTAMSLDQLNFKANQGGVAIEARLHVASAANVAIFVGFSDVISTTVELPIFKASGTDNIDSDATNACGIAYDTDGTTNEWFIGGVKAGTDTAATHAGSAPVASTYDIVRVEVDAAGAVSGYLNGLKIGTVYNAVTITTGLTPYIVVANRSAAVDTVTLDYVQVEQSR